MLIILYIYKKIKAFVPFFAVFSDFFCNSRHFGGVGIIFGGGWAPIVLAWLGCSGRLVKSEQLIVNK